MYRKCLFLKFAKQEIAPNAAHYDETEEFPWDNIHKMAELGLMGMPVPESLGGAETDTVTYVAAIEEIAKADAATGAIMAHVDRYYADPDEWFGRTEEEICS